MTYEFPKLSGVPYIRFLARMHRHLQPNWYLEVGTNTGRSLQKATGNAIAVDPDFKVSANVIGTRKQTHFYQMTSDAFYDGKYAKAHCDSIDFAFLDGLHLFEFLLRDFIGTEKLSTTDGVIAMHDCIPMTYVAAKRNWDTKATNAWTGDVWKLVPILKKYRPDLTIDVLDCPPSGLTIVTNLDPKNDTLERHYDEIISDFTELSLTDYGEEKLINELNIVNSRAYPANRFVGGTAPVVQPEKSATEVATEIVDSIRGLGSDKSGYDIRRMEPGVRGHSGDERSEFDGGPCIAIKIPPEDHTVCNHWGEYHFAVSLSKSLNKLGLKTRIDCRSEWYKNRTHGDVELVLRGGFEFEPISELPCIYWVLYPSKERIPKDLIHADHVFVASEGFAEVIRRKTSAGSVSVLLQCTDRDIFSPDTCSEPARENVLFVGLAMRHRINGGAVKLALEAGEDVVVWGRDWQAMPQATCRGERVPNEQLGTLYASANVVLNDHVPRMRKNGFVNNRVFDVLASGSALVMDAVTGIPEALRPYIYRYEDVASMRESLDKALSESEEIKRSRIEFAQYIRDNHSFDTRAIQIKQMMNALIAARSDNRRQING